MFVFILCPSIFFQVIVSLKKKKRYEKLNDAAYSALKYRDCAANVFFKDCQWPVLSNHGKTQYWEDTGRLRAEGHQHRHCPNFVPTLGACLAGSQDHPC